ncbi:major facilitator superfamily domain-containing protein [Dactylonectria macrodidyma]|uniref:Major facilitator superfamily domain-containing protein n=1 Tax=Dactylonectria macrodidyma TaxID=307937 RepID=A0A9P9J0G9_9HYPO|nr:major facilitator superfamily domain-containing protein [Dactylonectria macrodidyma]
MSPFSRCFSRCLSFIGADVLWSSSRNLKLLIILRMVRLLGYGGTTFVLAMYLNSLGFGDPEVGVFMTLTLVGDLAISFVLTYVGDAMGVRLTAIIGALLMCISGVAFAALDNFWLLLLASIIGVINPSANEIDPFKAIEEAAVARLSSPETRNEVFAWWSMLGMLGTAASNLLTGWVLDLLQNSGVKTSDSYRIIFLGYAATGVIKLFCCLLLGPDVEAKTSEKQIPEEVEQSNAQQIEESAPLLADTASISAYGAIQQDTPTPEAAASALAEAAHSKRMFTPSSFTFMWQLSLALIFDFIGSGLAQISWMTYFFKREFDIAEGALGSATFTAGIISSVLNLASSPLSHAIGQVPTMVVCHTINSISLLMVAVPANKYIALGIFIFRIITREIDNAPRQAFISAGVLDAERTSAMGVVNIVKTVGCCIGLYTTGLFAGRDQFWLAFIAAGVLKLVYNVLILGFFWRRPKVGMSTTR